MIDINKKVAYKWVNSMKPYGMMWDLEEIKRILKDKEWDCDPINFFIISNMIFNDYNNIILFNINLVFDLTKQWLNINDINHYHKYIKKTRNNI